MNKILKWCGNVLKSAWKTIKSFLKETIKDAPAATIMVLATIGTATILANTPIVAACTTVWFINESMIIPISAILITYILSTVAGRMYQAQLI